MSKRPAVQDLPRSRSRPESFFLFDLEEKDKRIVSSMDFVVLLLPFSLRGLETRRLAASRQNFCGGEIFRRLSAERWDSEPPGCRFRMNFQLGDPTSLEAGGSRQDAEQVNRPFLSHFGPHYLPESQQTAQIHLEGNAPCFSSTQAGLLFKLVFAET